MPKQKKQPKAVNPTPVEKTNVTLPTQQEIAIRAHEIYQARGGAHGCDLDDWLQAERELRAEAGESLLRNERRLNDNTN